MSKIALVRSATGKQVFPGDSIKTYGGERVKITELQPVTGHVVVQFDGKQPKVVYAAVIGCHFKRFRT